MNEKIGFFKCSIEQKQRLIKEKRKKITLLNKKYSLIGNTKIKPIHFEKIWDLFSFFQDENIKEICYQKWVELCKEDLIYTLEVYEALIKELKLLWQIPKEKAEIRFRNLCNFESFIDPLNSYLIIHLLNRNNYLTYKEQLQHPLWQKKRLEIMQRDNFSCVNCKDDQTILNVHHKKYINGKMPWEYLDKDLITLCEKCHSIIKFNKKNNE